MKSKHIPMTIEEFSHIEYPFGYKVEYWDGETIFIPREQNVRAKLDITERGININHNLKPVSSSLKLQMIDAFFESFKDSVEFCDWPEDKIRYHAEKI
jgi:hypothetical protein